MSNVVQKFQATHDFKSYEQSTTVFVTFGNIEYYLDQAPAEIITLQPSRSSDGLFSGLKGGLLPCTVIDWSKEQLDKEDLDAISAEFAIRDDVWTPVFLEGKNSCRHEIAIKEY